MLIAIMSEIYDQVTEEDAQSSASERISLLTDYSFFLDNFNLGLDAQYLYVVQPSSQDFIRDSVEEKIDDLAESIRYQQNTLR